MKTLTQKDTLHLSDGTTATLSDFNHADFILLYFYPKDNTPGCTVEAIDFTTLKKDFEKKNIVIIGVSPDSAESHQKFIAKHNLDILLATDAEHTLAKKFDAWGEKKNYGRVYHGIIRSTFLIDTKTGAVVQSWKNVRAKGHAQRVCDALAS